MCLGKSGWGQGEKKERIWGGGGGAVVQETTFKLVALLKLNYLERKKNVNFFGVFFRNQHSL